MNNCVHSNRRSSNRRSGRQNFSNCNGAPVEEEEQFKNRRSARRSPNRRTGRQNFRNKRVGKERFTFEENMLKYFLAFIGICMFLTILLSLLIRHKDKIHNLKNFEVP